MSLIVSGLGTVCNDLEEKNGFSRCRFAFRNGKEDDYIGLKFWHNDVNTEALKYIKKGRELFISGRLSLHEYKEKLYVDVNVQDFTFTRKSNDSTTKKADDDERTGHIPF